MSPIYLCDSCYKMILQRKYLLLTFIACILLISLPVRDLDFKNSEALSKEEIILTEEVRPVNDVQNEDIVKFQREAFHPNVPPKSSDLLKVPNACYTYPDALDIQFNNLYWQQFQTQRETFYLYGAYLGRNPNLLKTKT